MGIYARFMCRQARFIAANGRMAEYPEKDAAYGRGINEK